MERGIKQLEREERALERENQFAKLVTSAATSNAPLMRRAMVPPGAYFKLGQEGVYKTYVNQYTTNGAALSKQQAKEENEKINRLSHKFSLTEVRNFELVHRDTVNK